MAVTKAYAEVIDFIAGSSPAAVTTFRPSEETRARVADLLARQSEDRLSEAEAAELKDYLSLEHIMRLAKARARQFLAAK